MDAIASITPSVTLWVTPPSRGGLIQRLPLEVKLSPKVTEEVWLLIHAKV